jgi:1-acyl-sn-glycerol-3-phosphate acyltransferase
VRDCPETRDEGVYSPSSMATPGQADRAARLHALWHVPVGLVFTVGFTLGASAASLLTLGQCAPWLSPILLRFWGRNILRIQGVTLEVEGAEHLAGRAMRVATFNHTSTLDAMIVPALCPQGGVAAIKREVLYLPFVNLAVWSMGFLLIDRGRSARAQRLLQSAAARMARQRLTVFIAPEGTRSPDGALQPFKLGAFHVALASGAPIVPVVIDGAYDLMPRQRSWCAPGRVRVRILPPIDTTGLTREGLAALAESLHDTYARTLAEMRGTEPASA